MRIALTFTLLACLHACCGTFGQGADPAAVKHPNLLVNSQEIEAVKQKIRTQPWTQQSRVPAWDARGLPAMSWQGVACLDLSSDGRHVAVGTVAPSGDPNVLLLGPDGKLVRSWAAGQRWIQDVVVARDGRAVLAMCTTPEGRPDDAPTAFRCEEKVARVGFTLGQQDYPWTLFFYGDHSNHSGIVLRPYCSGAVGVWRESVCWLPGDPSAREAQVHVALPEHAVTVALAAAPNGEVLLGCASQPGKTGKASKAQPNLFLLAPNEKTPRWSRAPSRAQRMRQSRRRVSTARRAVPTACRTRCHRKTSRSAPRCRWLSTPTRAVPCAWWPAPTT